MREEWKHDEGDAGEYKDEMYEFEIQLVQNLQIW